MLKPFSDALWTRAPSVESTQGWTIANSDAPSPGSLGDVLWTLRYVPVFWTATVYLFLTLASYNLMQISLYGGSYSRLWRWFLHCFRLYMCLYSDYSSLIQLMEKISAVPITCSHSEPVRAWIWNIPGPGLCSAHWWRPWDLGRWELAERSRLLVSPAGMHLPSSCLSVRFLVCHDVESSTPHSCHHDRYLPQHDRLSPLKLCSTLGLPSLKLCHRNENNNQQSSNSNVSFQIVPWSNRAMVGTMTETRLDPDPLCLNVSKALASSLDGLNNVFLSKVIGTLVNNLGNIYEGASRTHSFSWPVPGFFLKKTRVIPNFSLTLTCSLTSRSFNSSNP